MAVLKFRSSFSNATGHPTYTLFALSKCRPRIVFVPLLLPILLTVEDKDIRGTFPLTMHKSSRRQKQPTHIHSPI
jgi:hypothetical protein